MAHPTGMRLLARPEVVRPCLSCGELVGRGYPACRECEQQVEKYWLADWLAVLESDSVLPEALIRIVLRDETWRYPWTCVDWALRLSTCAECGAESATGPLGCVACAVADERRWARDHHVPGRLSDNERAIRTARAALRAPTRHRATVVSYWRLVLPFLLTGEMSSAARGAWLRASLISGRYRELAACERYEDLAAMLELPWRGGDEPDPAVREESSARH